MEAINENDVLKESIKMMEEKLTRKLFLVNKKEVSKNAEIEKRPTNPLRQIMNFIFNTGKKLILLPS